MGCYGLGYLPCGLMIDGLNQLRQAPGGVALTAIAGWIAENHGKTDDAADIWRLLLHGDTGFAHVAQQALARLGRDE